MTLCFNYSLDLFKSIMNTHFFSCFPRLKWSRLDGWKTSTEGAVGGEHMEEVSQ